MFPQGYSPAFFPNDYKLLPSFPFYLKRITSYFAIPCSLFDITIKLFRKQCSPKAIPLPSSQMIISFCRRFPPPCRSL